VTTNLALEPTIKLSQEQRDFLGEYYREDCEPSQGPAHLLAKDSGFTYDHFKYLWFSYSDSWDGDFSSWDGHLPPLREIPSSLPFTTEELRETLRVWAEYEKKRATLSVEARV
jgi:hypothetical protein